LWSVVAIRQVGPVDLPACQPKPGEGLRRGDLVDQVHVDEEQVGLAPRAVDDVLVPDLPCERLGHDRIRLLVEVTR